jgi:hypothetical protein
MLDNNTKQQHKLKTLESADFKRKLVQQMYQSGELEQLLNGGAMQYKSAEEMDPSAGIFAKALQMQNHPARLLLGGQSGFRDAKKDYYMREKENIAKELMHAQKEYIDTLARIKTGEASDTPCVDAFCNGIAHMALFGKTASHKDIEIEDGSLRRLAGDALSVVKKPFSPVSNAVTGGLANAGAAAAWLTFLARQQAQRKHESYMTDQQPTRVELEPY